MLEQQRALRGVAFRRPAPWRRLSSRALHFLAILVMGLGARLAHAATYTGTVFEDVNYGGGDGRSLTASAGVPMANVTVELYRASNGNWVATTTTNSSGFYSLTSSGGNAALSMYVRVVNGTVRSSRAGGAACTTCVPVQTFRTNATAAPRSAVTDHVGGEAPGSSDAVSILARAASERSPRVAACRSLLHRRRHRAARSPSAISISVSTSTPSSTHATSTACAATNSSYPCQGSLRQFVINANALGGEGALAQSGSGQIDGSTSVLPAGFESSIFMIPSACARPRANRFWLRDHARRRVAHVTGVQHAARWHDPDRECRQHQRRYARHRRDRRRRRRRCHLSAARSAAHGGGTVLTLAGSSSAVLGFALRQGYILLSGTGCLARNNLVGMTATGTQRRQLRPPTASRSGRERHGAQQLRHRQQLRHPHDSGGTARWSRSTKSRDPTSGHTNTFDGILLVGTVSSIQITANLARDQRGGGIEVGFGGGAAASNITVTNNTVHNNGFRLAAWSRSTEPIGMAAYDYDRQQRRVQPQPGARQRRARHRADHASTGTTITQNSFSSNGGASASVSIDGPTRAIRTRSARRRA